MTDPITLTVVTNADAMAYTVDAKGFAQRGIDGTAKLLASLVASYPKPMTAVRLKIEWPDRTTELQWAPAQATAENIAKAFAAPLRREQLDGKLTMRRYVLPWGWTVMPAKEVGPPRWWWPHLGINVNRHRLWLLVGWNFTAYHVSIHWSWPEDGRR